MPKSTAIYSNGKTPTRTGIVTPTFSSSLDQSALSGWGNGYDPAKAKSLLAQAGYHMSGGVMTNAAGQKLAAGEALWLFAAVTRLAAAQKSTVRSRLVHLDGAGAMQLSRFDEKRAEDEQGYLAPELLERGAPAKSEPRVQVYAAGALGYELLTGQPAPDPRKGPGAELAGPFADLVRIAMAHDRRERFGDLQQLREAVDALQRPAGADSERQAFAALVARSEKWAGVPDMDRAALAKLIEHVSHLGKQMDAVRSGMAVVTLAVSRSTPTASASFFASSAFKRCWPCSAAARYVASLVPILLARSS